MRLTVMTNMAKSLPLPADPDRAPPPEGLATNVGKELERIKWFLWHGNVFHALQTVQDLEIDLGIEEPNISQAKLLKALREFGGDIQANTGRVPNYGERYRAGETISTAFVESAINQVMSKRRVKKQQMRWTPRGAHLLLQLRTRVLNDDLANDFYRWYPNFTHTTDHQKLTA